MNYWWILYIIDIILFIPVAFTTFYFLVFAIAAQFSRHHDIPKAKRHNRFIVLIPAYRSDYVILQTVQSILGQTYPQRMFDVVVISDHEEELTNMHLKQQPITLLTPNFEKSTKAKSLQYAMLNLPEFKIYDIAVVLDADNIVEPDFLEQLNDAYESAGTKAIQVHRLSKNRDTASARLDSIFEEINNSIFRKGHTTLGLSATISGSGMAFDFSWFKTNIMFARTAGEDKELEAMLMLQHIYVDYFEEIHVFDEKTRNINQFNKQRGRWAATQFHSLLHNIKYLPKAIINREYDLIDKIIQWMLVPRTIMMGMVSIMSIILPFIYFALVIKWWTIAAVALFVFALATPNYLVDKNWDKDFLHTPKMITWALINMFSVTRRSKRFININK